MITSTKNPKIQAVRALLAHHKDRIESRQFVIEGVRLVEEALASGLVPGLVFYTSGLSERGKKLLQQAESLRSEVEEISPAVMESLSGTETPQGILAVLPMLVPSLPQALNFVLVADSLRDPGNLGTLLRSAAAGGVQAVLLPPTTTDAFAPKVVRSGMGAHFRLPVLHMSWEQIEAVVKSRARSLRVFAADAENGTPCWQVNFRQPAALLVGGEAEGISPQGMSLADEAVTIPMPGGSESLNAAVAASILIFEVNRQRQA